MRLHHPTEPCSFMEGLLQSEVSGETGGFGRFFVKSHTSRCPGCRKFLADLQANQSALLIIRSVDADEEAIARLKDGAWRTAGL